MRVAAGDMATAAAALVAHQGGWDEILLVLGPILLIGGLLRLAKHRVTRTPADRNDRASTGDEPRPGATGS